MLPAREKPPSLVSSPVLSFLGDLARVASAEQKAPSGVGLAEAGILRGQGGRAPFPGAALPGGPLGGRGPPVLAVRGEEGAARDSPEGRDLLVPGARRSLLEGADGPGSPPSGCRRRAQGRRVQGAGALGPRPEGVARQTRLLAFQLQPSATVAAALRRFADAVAAGASAPSPSPPVAAAAGLGVRVAG